MTEIKQLFHIAAPRNKVYEALTTTSGLAAWWTVQTSGESVPGGTLEFRFGAQFFNKMKVLEMKPNETLVWECVQGAPDWIGTKITLSLDENEGKTRVRFSHVGFKEANDFYAQCNFSWGRYMESLRNYCEKGKGTPFSAG
jgi:uncharacterized protein YndB with AHSA1/START domain